MYVYVDYTGDKLECISIYGNKINQETCVYIHICYPSDQLECISVLGNKKYVYIYIFCFTLVIN